MRSLYEISQEYEAFLSQVDEYVALIEAGELPQEAFDDTIAGIRAELDDKIDAVACVVKNHLAMVEALQNEKRAIERRLSAEKKAVDRLCDYIGYTMRAAGKDKLQSPRNVLSFRRSEGVAIADLAAFLAWARENGRTDLLTVKEPTPALTEIKRAINAGEDIVGAVIEERYNLQIK